MVRKSDEAGSLLQRINELIEAVHVAAVSHLASIRESRSLACQLLACAHS
jgi:hypothetical protein